MEKNKSNKIKEVVELEKKIEDSYLLIRKGIDIVYNNSKIEECMKEKCKYYGSSLVH